MTGKLFTITQLPLSVKLRDDATFKNFYTCSPHCSHCVDYLKHLVADTDRQHESISYLWGQPGVGKTHLLQASCHNVRENSQTSFYLPLRDYQQFSPDILLDLEQLAVICLDDISAIAGERIWEENLFHLYNRVFISKSRLIIADRFPAQELAIKLKDLHSRLIGSVALEINDLLDSEKLIVLQKRANARGMELTDEVGQFLLRRCDRSMANLFNILNQLDLASLSAQRKLTIPFVKAVLGI